MFFPVLRWIPFVCCHCLLSSLFSLYFLNMLTIFSIRWVILTRKTRKLTGSSNHNVTEGASVTKDFSTEWRNLQSRLWSMLTVDGCECIFKPSNVKPLGQQPVENKGSKKAPSCKKNTHHEQERFGEDCWSQVVFSMLKIWTDTYPSCNDIKDLPAEFLQKLFASVSRWIDSVLKANVGHAK